MKQKKEPNPANLYMRGDSDSWILDFYFKGQRYTEALGPVSRSRAKEIRDKRKGDAAAGILVVNGKRWLNRQWVVELETSAIEDPTFDVAMQKFLDWYKAENAPYTYKKYALTASKNLKAYFDKYQLSQISLVLIEKYKHDRKTACSCASGPTRDAGSGDRCTNCKCLIKSKANATVNRELTLLRHLFNKMIDFRLAKSNPFRVVQQLADGSYRVQKVKLYKEHGRERYLDQEEQQRLLDQCNRDLKLPVLMAMHTGFRSSELKSMRWLNVDFVNASATVQSRYAKNGETRTVPLSDDVLAALTKAKEERKPKPEDHIFLLDGEFWKSWREAFNGAVERAGIQDFRFHDLRHCFGSHLGMNNVNPKAMMELMGHKDPKMTLRYTHLSVEYKRQAVHKLPRLSILEEKSQQNSQQPGSKKVVGFSK